MGHGFGPAARANPNSETRGARGRGCLPLPETAPPASRAQAPVGVRPALFRAGLSPARLSTTNWFGVASVVPVMFPCFRDVPVESPWHPWCLLCPRGQSDFGKRADGWRRVKNRRTFHAVKVRSIRFSADSRPIPKSLYRAGFGSTFCRCKRWKNRKCPQPGPKRRRPLCPPSENLAANLLDDYWGGKIKLSLENRIYAILFYISCNHIIKKCAMHFCDKMIKSIE